MKKCIKCGSHAFNLYAEEIDQGEFCDVHYWQGRAHRAEALAQQEQEPLEYWNAVEGWVKIDEVREHFGSVGCGTIYKTAGEDRVPVYASPPQRQLESTTDMMMGLADRLGELPDDIDPRAWEHLLVYAPKRQPLTESKIKAIANIEGMNNRVTFARAIEAAHNIKETEK